MIKINLTILGNLWQAFRIACLQRKTSASKEVARLMREQLDRWQQEEKETSH